MLKYTQLATPSHYGTAALDAFARLRTSEPLTLFDSKQLYDKAPLYRHK